MDIKGFIKNSFLDWDGKIASMIFTGGCNFLCPFCHNKNLVLNSDLDEKLDKNEIFEYLIENSKWIDGIVISGGEPTIHKDLIPFIKEIKAKNFLVKLDTNGYNPDVLEILLKDKLIDYVAMDIKTALIDEKYKKATGLEDKKFFDIKKILKSIELIAYEKLKNKNFDFEFRTTICPVFVNNDDLINIADFIKDLNSKWYWQNFRKLGDLLDDSLLLIKPYTIGQLEDFRKNILNKFPKLNIKTRY